MKCTKCDRETLLPICGPCQRDMEQEVADVVTAGVQDGRLLKCGCGRLFVPRWFGKLIMITCRFCAPFEWRRLERVFHVETKSA